MTNHSAAPAAETKTVYIVWTNTDLTEGRGFQVPLHICETMATAIRLSKRAGVQGCDADVRSFEAVKVGAQWCAPFVLKTATREDVQAQKQIDARNAALAKAKAVGLSDDDLRALGSDQ